MTTDKRRRSVLAASLILAGGDAAAQLSFDPPLDAPTPLSQPIYLELQTHSQAACVFETRSAEPDGAAAPGQTVTTVQEAPGGVLLTVVDTISGARTVLFFGDDGAKRVEVDGLDGRGLSEEARAAIHASIIEAAPAAALHQRSLSQGETVVGAEVLKRLVAPMLQSLPPDARVDSSGGWRVAGESMSENRRVLVVHAEAAMDASDQENGEGVTFSVSLEGRDAIDVETTYPLYSEYRLIISIASPDGPA